MDRERVQQTHGIQNSSELSTPFRNEYSFRARKYRLLTYPKSRGFRFHVPELCMRIPPSSLKRLINLARLNAKC